MIATMRGLVAKCVQASGAYRALDAVCARLAGGFILAYHNPPPERVVEHVRALEPSRPVPLGELVERHTRGASTVGLFAITFDDGVAATVRAIAPLARRQGWPVTFFIPTAYVESRRAMPFQWLQAIRAHLPAERITVGSEVVDLMGPGARAAFVRDLTRRMCTRPRAEYEPLVLGLADLLVARGIVDPDQLQLPAAVGWDEVAQLARDDLLRFESHGVSHVAVAALPLPELERELRESGEIIAAHTGRSCDHFCYPFGGRESIGDAAPGIVARFYKSAVTMVRGRVGARTRELLPRIPLYPHDDAALARLKVLTT